MANKYFSVLRDYVARNVAEVELSLPGTGEITVQGDSTDWKRQLCTRFSINMPDPDSNLVLKECAVFSNFADGLVFANANESIDLSIHAIGVWEYASIGNVSTTLGSKTMTGAGFAASLSAGTFIRINIPASNLYYFAIVDSVTDDNNAELRDYAQRTLTAQAGDKVVSSSVDSYRMRNIRALNTFYKSEYYFTPSTIIAAGETSLDILITVQPNFGNGITHDDIVFHTNSISDTFNEDALYFDSIIRAEVTPRT